MARRFHLLIFSGLLAASVGWSQNPEEPKPSPTPAKGAAGKQRPDFFQRKGPGHEGGFRKLDDFPPEQREKLIENFKRWQNLPPEQKKEIMERLGKRRERMKQEIEEAITQSGLQLDEERRAAFVSRYMQERRKIEEALHKEFEEKRKPLLAEMMQRLKAEFSTNASPAPSPSAVQTPR
jgi:hypothetical protein